MRYRLYTLVDITETGQYRNEPDKMMARCQQQNFNTVTQTIGMRANVYYDNPPKIINDVPKKFNMDGDEESSIWVFDWDVELEFAFRDGDDELAFLKNDFNLVPYIADLKETIKYNPAVFRPGVNISFEIVR